MSRLHRLALLAALLLATAPALAQEGGTKGTLNAMIFRPAPESRTVMVRAMDNSDQNIALQTELEKILQAKGYSLAKDAPLLLTFETRDEAGAFSDGGRRTILELESYGGGPGGDTQKARVNVFDSQSGGLVNEGSAPGTRIVTPDRYRIDLTLEEKGGQRLWQGWATATTHAGTPLATNRAMLGPLVEAIGRTVRRQALQLP